MKSKSSKRLVRKVIICLLGMLATLSMTGCGESLKQFVSEELQQRVNDKYTANRTILDQLKAAQFITDTEYTNWMNSIQKSEDKLTKDLESAMSNGTVSGNLQDCIVNFRVINGSMIYHNSTDEDGNSRNYINDDNGNPQQIHWLTDDGDCDRYESNVDGNGNVSTTAILSTSILTDFLVANGKLSLPSGSDHWKWSICDGQHNGLMPQAKRNESDIEPIKIVDEKIQTAVQEKFDYTIYVLKPNLENAGNFNSVDNLIAAVNSCLTETQLSTGVSGFTVTNTGLLDTYFTKAVDDNGDPITLISKTASGEIPEEYKIVTLSGGNDLYSDDNGVTPGKDLVVSQYNIPEFTMRFMEFNQEHWDNLRNVMGLNDTQYIFCTSNGEKRAYLMEYPVYYLSEINYDESTDTVTGYINGYDKSTVTNTSCSLGLNLATGKIIKYAWNGSSWTKSGSVSVSDTVQNYLTTTSEQTNGETGLSSFIVKGASKMDVGVDLETGTSKRTVTTGRIILRDYLEATYAPGFVDGESLVVFGRKIRINFNTWQEETFKGNSNYKQYTPTWSLSETFATYIDSTGNRIDTLPTLKATDFGDVYAVRFSDSTTWTNNVLITLTPLGIADGTLVDGTVESGVIHDVDDLPHKYDNKTKLLITMAFPYVSSSSKQAIGAADWSTDSAQKQRFYTMFVAMNMFDSSLFSQWINVESSSNSLNWWNEYLASYTYTYTVNHEALNEYLKTNFTYELNQNGVVILDLDTVSKISQIYQTEDDEKRVSNIKTFFLLLGWFLICYSMILMLAWTLDANTDIGVKLLEKLTFGNWVAVKYETDIPYKNTNDRTYLTCGKMMQKCMVVVLVGVILINVNIFKIVLKLIEMFGTLATQLEEFISGIRY